MKPIQVIDDFFDQELYRRIYFDSFKDWTIHPTNTVYKDLTDDFYTKVCERVFVEKLQKPVRVDRGYSMAFPRYIDDNHWHQDKGTSHSAILFVANEYNSDWLGGSFILDREEEVHYINFRPNRIIVFEADLLHTGMPFRNTPKLRKICVWKLNIDEAN